jgi:hypothetical protein
MGKARRVFKCECRKRRTFMITMKAKCLDRRRIARSPHDGICQINPMLRFPFYDRNYKSIIRIKQTAMERPSQSQRVHHANLDVSESAMTTIKFDDRGDSLQRRRFCDLYV